MASGRLFSHTLFSGCGGKPGPLPSALTDPTLQTPLLSATQWPLVLFSRQPVCPALMPDAEINTSHNSIVSHFRSSQVILEVGLDWHLGSSGVWKD